MTSAQTTIVSDYELNGATPEQIAADMELDILAVKATLMQFSPKYRESTGQKDLQVNVKAASEDISASEYDEILAAYKNVALYSENDNVRERALRNLINEHKGRNDEKKDKVIKQSGTINVITLNQLIVEAKQKALQNAIEVGVIEEPKKLTN